MNIGSRWKLLIEIIGFIIIFYKLIIENIGFSNIFLIVLVIF